MGRDKMNRHTNEKVIEVTIDVPTGELFFVDWPAHGEKIIGHLDEKTARVFDVEEIRLQRTRDYAEENIGHFRVPNIGQNIYEKEGTFYIGRESYDDDDNEIPLVEGSTEVGDIDIDLWWVTVCDKGIYEALAQKVVSEEEAKKIANEAIEKASTVLHVRPGTYRLRYFTDLEEELHATLTKI